jgi:hypothetical protein
MHMLPSSLDPHSDHNSDVWADSLSVCKGGYEYISTMLVLSTSAYCASLRAFLRCPASWPRLGSVEDITLWCIHSNKVFSCVTPM